MAAVFNETERNAVALDKLRPDLVKTFLCGTRTVPVVFGVGKYRVVLAVEVEQRSGCAGGSGFYGSGLGAGRNVCGPGRIGEVNRICRDDLLDRVNGV